MTWLACSWRVRDAQKRSRGFAADQMFRSPTCGPSGVEMRIMLPAGAFQALPERGGRVKEVVGGLRAAVAMRV